MLDANITFVGNLIDNPNLKVTATGAYVCSFRLASAARRYDRGENRWIDGPPLFIDVICWRRLAEHVAASLGKGDRALVCGRLQQNEFQTLQGDRRRRYEIYAEAVGLELTWHPARINRAMRGDGAMAVQLGPTDAAGAPPSVDSPDPAAPDDPGALTDPLWAEENQGAEAFAPGDVVDEVSGDAVAGWAVADVADGERQP